MFVCLFVCLFVCQFQRHLMFIYKNHSYTHTCLMKNPKLFHLFFLIVLFITDKMRYDTKTVTEKIMKMMSCYFAGLVFEKRDYHPLCLFSISSFVHKEFNAFQKDFIFHPDFLFFFIQFLFFSGLYA